MLNGRQIYKVLLALQMNTDYIYSNNFLLDNIRSERASERKCALSLEQVERHDERCTLESQPNRLNSPSFSVDAAGFHFDNLLRSIRIQ